MIPNKTYLEMCEEAGKGCRITVNHTHGKMDMCGKYRSDILPLATFYCVGCTRLQQTLKQCGEEQAEFLEKLRTECDFQFMKKTNNLIWMLDKTIITIKKGLKELEKEPFCEKASGKTK